VRDFDRCRPSRSVIMTLNRKASHVLDAIKEMDRPIAIRDSNRIDSVHVSAKVAVPSDRQ
jgi:hypothetical protein